MKSILVLILLSLSQSVLAFPVGGRLVSAFVGELANSGRICSLVFSTPQGKIGLIGDFDECAVSYGQIETAKTSFNVVKVESSSMKPVQNDEMVKDLRRINPKAKFYRLERRDFQKVLSAL